MQVSDEETNASLHSEEGSARSLFFCKTLACLVSLIYIRIIEYIARHCEKRSDEAISHHMYHEIFTLHSNLLKAMAHPKRLEIIHLLRNQTLSVTEIQNMLDLPQANLSQHLQILRNCEVVKATKKGKQIHYELSHPHFLEACDLIREVLIAKNSDNSLCQEFRLKMSDLVPLVTDPVCGMRLSPKTAGFVTQHADKSYYFCASGCLREFESKPNYYLAEIK